MKHYKLVEYLSNLNVKPPCTNVKSSPHKRKTPLLTTFWRRVCAHVRDYSTAWVWFA